MFSEMAAQMSIKNILVNSIKKGKNKWKKERSSGSVINYYEAMTEEAHKTGQGKTEGEKILKKRRVFFFKES